MEIRIAENDAAIGDCFPVLKQLRPHLNETDFVTDVRRLQGHGYELAFLKDQEVRAVAGFRVVEMFATGKMLYVDDLVTDAACRSKGYGKVLLDWLKKETTRRGCKYLNLDSGSQRADAHRFYETNGFEVVALHFSVPVDGVPKWSATLS